MINESGAIMSVTVRGDYLEILSDGEEMVYKMPEDTEQREVIEFAAEFPESGLALDYAMEMGLERIR